MKTPKFSINQTVAYNSLLWIVVGGHYYHDQWFYHLERRNEASPTLQTATIPEEDAGK